MTYKFKIRELLNENGEFTKTAIDLAVAYNVLAAEKGIEFKLIADSRDREHITIVTEEA
jgi:hypothetical protein